MSESFSDKIHKAYGKGISDPRFRKSIIFVKAASKDEVNFNDLIKDEVERD